VPAFSKLRPEKPDLKQKKSVRARSHRFFEGIDDGFKSVR
jgi:hypothetical protein